MAVNFNTVFKVYLASDSPPFASATSISALIDSPLARSAGREVLSLALMDARNHTLHLLSRLQKALEGVPLPGSPVPGVNPPLWDAAHAGWFQEWWIGRNMQRALGTRCASGHTRLASIEPGADGWWSGHVQAAARWAPGLPDAAHVRAFLLDTLEGTLDLLSRAAEDDDALYFYRLSLFHEDMIGEGLLRTAQTLGLALDAPFADALVPASAAAREPVLVPATTWPMGSPATGAGFAFDNEQPQHAIAVPAFEIDAQPVTWSQFVEFVDDGGYDRAELWHPDGWRWLQALAEGEGRRGPRYVDQIGVASGAVMQVRFGQPRRAAGNQVAMHMSWWEADAWCRWAGRRLPAEVEWEVAAHSASRRGFRWGDAWEWTGTTFRPYDGFTAGPWLDYSQPAFGTAKVLRGASLATRARMKNPKFRNFAAPARDDLFCGFRSCAL